jgi:PIN domain nuclease of toxin-antitoxin system
MRILLDTHVFLWFIAGDAKLPGRYRASILDPANEIVLSVASVWEAVIKHQIGKLSFAQPPETYLPLQRAGQGFLSLEVDEATMIPLASLPLFHRDPFDRLLIAHAMQHGLTIATVDPLFAPYPVTILPTT